MAEPEIPEFKLPGPQYRLSKPLYDNATDTYIPEGAVIDFPGIPNEHMEPLNEAAVKALTDWYKSKGGATPALGDIAAAAVAARAKEPIVPQIQVVSGPKTEPALMGDMSPKGDKKLVPTEKPGAAKVIPQAERPKFVRPTAAPVGEVNI